MSPWSRSVYWHEGHRSRYDSSRTPLEHRTLVHISVPIFHIGHLDLPTRWYDGIIQKECSDYLGRSTVSSYFLQIVSWRRRTKAKRWTRVERHGCKNLEWPVLVALLKCCSWWEILEQLTIFPCLFVVHGQFFPSTLAWLTWVDRSQRFSS